MTCKLMVSTEGELIKTKKMQIEIKQLSSSKKAGGESKNYVACGSTVNHT